MKKIKYIYVLFLILISFQIKQLKSQSTTIGSWTQLSFIPAHGLYSVSCLNYDTVVAVGDSGYIIRTTNNGDDWFSIASNTPNTLYKVSFVNDTIGFAVGANGTILKTIDYGQSWSNIGINTNMNLLDISFINKDTGWVAGGIINNIRQIYGSKGILMKTTDGGINWVIDSAFKTIASVNFINKDSGFICMNYYDSVSSENFAFLKRTTDGGNSFSLIKQDTSILGYFTNINFINHKTGYFVNFGNEGGAGIYKTTDYGNTWSNYLIWNMVRNLFVVDSCSFYISQADMAGCFFYEHDLCPNNDISTGIGLWMSASILDRYKGFAVNVKTLICTSYSFIYKLDIPLEVTEKSSTKFELYPNPLSNSTLISLPENLEPNNITIDIFDLQGKIIKTIKSLSTYQYVLSRNDFNAAGVYFLRIKSNKYLETIKLVVQ